MRTFGFVFLALVLAQAAAPAESLEEFVSDYCLSCHNDVSRTGGISLETFDAAHPETAAEVAEKMVRKLDAGMMPPSFAPQPEAGTAEAFATALAARIDEAAEKSPNPGRRAFQRLNRAEYARSVRDLLAIEVDVEALLPPVTVSHGFDNIADVQGMSPAVMDGYLRAAEKISREAIGDPAAEDERGLHLPADFGRGRAPLLPRDREPSCDPSVSKAARRSGPRRSHELLRNRPQGRGFREWDPDAGAADPAFPRGARSPGEPRRQEQPQVRFLLMSC